MKLKFILLINIFSPLFLLSTIYSQNSIPNCSFENFSACPTNFSQINHCEDWYSPGEGTPDYCNACSTSDLCCVPNNLWGNQMAYDSGGYTHIICYYPLQNRVEYLQVELACSLLSEVSYNVSFMVSCSDRSRYAIDGMGLQFSADSLLQNGTNFISLQGYPDISNTPGSILKNKTSWMEISGVYTSTGDEKFITIGNFIDNTNLQTHTFPPSSNELLLASYYIDYISITPTISTLNLGNDTTLCSGESLILNASINCANTYSWNNGLTDSIIVISSSGNYKVDVDVGCGNISDEISIQYFPSPNIPFPNDTSICAGTNILLDAGTEFNNYLWQDGSIDQYFNVDTEGLYWVEIEDVTGCFVKDSVNIGMITFPFFQLGNDTVLCYDNSITLHANITGLYMEYLWSDYSTEQELFVTNTGNYWLQVSNPCGSNTDSIQVNYRNCVINIFLPNAFTPNGDGKNDVFIPKGLNITYFKMYIFNRWGERLFESNSILEGWDGYFNGALCPMGSYVWVIEYEGLSSKLEPKAETLRGTVTLLR